ncbi:LysR family transcriptional regulator [Lyngbya confervoides]|uniref:LysR substrate-binding domain-containing protein n=1 Tax=Lyngbya confervoides BDU141951 TaxID=1574623 RepID=A0ABD4T2Q8_9CYAN|nr:LysR family transcriptional regulator [Lyngbya confervoides]MCM1982676.1 LysR substrate-binding domain-containing protein [Lyngbya confervoides BDU141951]
MKQVTFHQLKVFEVTARRGSFTRAAEELFLTQPTVSIQMKQLSKAVGLPLFEQVGKRLFLTDAGQQLLDTCQDIFQRLEQFEMTVADMQGMKQGKLRLAVISTAKYIIPRLLGPFCQRYPGIDVSLTVTNHEKVVERLRHNLDDLYIPSQIPEGLDVTCRTFLENPLVVLASRNHPLAKIKQVRLEQLNGQDFIMREVGSGTRQAVEKLLEEHGIEIRVRLELGSNEAIKQAVAGGLGVSVLSHHCLALEGETGQIVVLNVEQFPIRRHWNLVYPRGKQLSIVANTFYEYLLTEGRQVLQDTAVCAPS